MALALRMAEAAKARFSGRLPRAARRQSMVMAALLGLGAFVAPSATQNAVANGDTRTLTLHNAHNNEDISITYLVNGVYDSSALQKLNWFARDWRHNEAIKMDPRLFDTVWEVIRHSGTRRPVELLSGYRSPATNAMLRRHSRGVAKQSQHMVGKAMDLHFDDVGMSRIRDIGMRLQRGGVGYYPRAGTPFVHLDVGSVRYWPRMSYDQLSRLFPDGKTVFIPSNGQPLPGYDLALAEIEAHGGTAFQEGQRQSKGLFSFLFGGGGEDDATELSEAAPATRAGRGKRGKRAVASAPAETRVALAAPSGDDAGSRSFFSRAFSRAAPEPEAQTAIAKPEPLPEPVAAKAEPKAAPAPQVAAVDARALAAETKRLEDARAVQEKVAEDARAELARQKFEQRLADAPFPPRRPSETRLALLNVVDVPAPPERPAHFAPIRAAGKKLSALEGEAGLPALITEGAGQRGLAGAQALAYAAEPKASLAAPAFAAPTPEPVRRPPAAALYRADVAKAKAPTFVAARIDRATFRALTAQTPAARQPQSARASLAPTLAPVRAARAAMRQGELSADAQVVTRFGERPMGDLSSSRFGGAAVAALPRQDGFGDLPLRLTSAE